MALWGLFIKFTLLHQDLLSRLSVRQKKVQRACWRKQISLSPRGKSDPLKSSMKETLPHAGKLVPGVELSNKERNTIRIFYTNSSQADVGDSREKKSAFSSCCSFT